MLAKTSCVSLTCGKSTYRFRGRSRAGEATSFSIPEYKWLFDCGALIEGWKPEFVFLTHGHSDHLHYLTHIRNEENPPTIFLPKQLAPFVKAHLTAYQEMNDCMTQAESQNGGLYPEDCIFRPVTPGEEITIRQKGAKFVILTLGLDHRVPCVGYSIFRIQDQLKEEYKGLPGKEIGRLKKEGIDITDSVRLPFICFLGDTTGAVFDRHPEILEQHKVIVVECSFMEEADIDRARTSTHMHWFDLRKHVAAHPDVMFLLTHFSLKYNSLELREFFNRQHAFYPNVHPMLDDEEVEDIWWRKKRRNEIEGDQLAPPTCSCRLCCDNLLRDSTD